MAESEKRTDEMLDKIVLDVKALVLLQGSDPELKERLRRKLVDSKDEDMRRFVEALQVRPSPRHAHLLLIALGELVLASLLVFAGTVALIPTVAGIDTPAALAQFFAEKAFGAIGSSPFADYSSFIEFVVGALLVLSALYTLRQAALNLKQLGLAIEPGEG